MRSKFIPLKIRTAALAVIGATIIPTRRAEVNAWNKQS